MLAYFKIASQLNGKTYYSNSSFTPQQCTKWQAAILACVWITAYKANASEDDLLDFLSYLATTWIGPINQRTGARRSPIFKHELWNKTQASDDGDETTTNCSEGFNNAIQLSIPHNANVFSIIKQFRSEDSLVEVKLRDAAISPDPEASRTRRTNWEKRQQDLKHLVENYDNLSTKKYMGYLVDFFNHTLDFVWFDAHTKVLTNVRVHW